MAAFVEIPASFLASIATDNERIPTLYFSASSVTRHVFWQRLRWLHQLACRYADLSRPCLDFGAGGGVFLPTLASTFERVVSIDLVTREALRVVEHFGLRNVAVVEADATAGPVFGAPFGTVIAADVLEHFADLAPPVEALHRALAPDGLLLTSLPTENILYGALRRLQGVEKPTDHYHRAVEVEAILQRSGFRRIAHRFVPLHVRIAPLYAVTAWRKEPGAQGRGVS